MYTVAVSKGLATKDVRAGKNTAEGSAGKSKRMKSPLPPIPGWSPTPVLRKLDAA